MTQVYISSDDSDDRGGGNPSGAPMDLEGV